MNNFLSLIGFLLPPVIDLINNKIASSYVRFWLSVLVCAIVGAFIEWAFVGVLTIEGVSTQILLTFAMASLSYGALWKGSNADNQLKKIQN